MIGVCRSLCRVSSASDTTTGFSRGAFFSHRHFSFNRSTFAYKSDDGAPVPCRHRRLTAALAVHLCRYRNSPGNGISAVQAKVELLKCSNEVHGDLYSFDRFWAGLLVRPRAYVCSIDAAESKAKKN